MKLISPSRFRGYREFPWLADPSAKEHISRLVTVHCFDHRNPGNRVGALRAKLDSDIPGFIWGCTKMRCTIAVPHKMQAMFRTLLHSPLAIEVIAFLDDMISLGHPFGAARLFSAGGISSGLSNTQKDWM